MPPQRALMMTMMAATLLLAGVCARPYGTNVSDMSAGGRQQQEVGPCVCVFDFDLTLRVVRGANEDAEPWEADAVLNKCRQVPCYMAIASANDNGAKISKELFRFYGKNLTNPSLDHDKPNVYNTSAAFFNSPAFQYGWHNKSVMLLKIQEYFQVPIYCITLFDDMIYNKDYAIDIGAQFSHVNGTVGLRMVDYWDAKKDLPGSCFPGHRRS